MLEVRNADAFYGQVQAVSGISLSVAQHDLIGILGSNGAGKSTILKMISGLLRPRRGEVLFEGRSITSVDPARLPERGLVHVPEGRHVFAKMTVRENLIAGSYIKSAWRRRDEAIQSAYELFPRLRERKDQLAGSLSGGEQQMLSIARALAVKPRLLLLDEPTLGLAPVIVDDLFEAIVRIHESGCAVVVVEQNIRALEIVSRTYLLDHGRIVYEGSAADVTGNGLLEKTYLGMGA